MCILVCSYYIFTYKLVFVPQQNTTLDGIISIIDTNCTVYYSIYHYTVILFIV